jgi:hypothetical protein
VNPNKVTQNPLTRRVSASGRESSFLNAQLENIGAGQRVTVEKGEGYPRQLSLDGIPLATGYACGLGG